MSTSKWPDQDSCKQQKFTTIVNYAGIWTENQEEQTNTRLKNKIQYVPNELGGKSWSQIPIWKSDIFPTDIADNMAQTYFNRQNDLL